MSRRAFLGTVAAATAMAAAPGIFPPVTYRGRMILYHGLNSTAGEFAATDPFDDLISGLQAQGWAVTLSSYNSGTTYLQGLFGADSTGLNYRNAMVAEYDALLPTIPNVGGPTVLLGISWGGLVAMQIAGRAAVQPDAAIVHLPALDPNFLTEFTAYSLTALEALDTTALGALDDCYISWATDDTRVGYTVAKNLKENVLMCAGHEYTTLGHTTNSTVVAALLAYTATL